MPSTSVFYGPVINPVSVNTYQALPRCLLAVGANGNIDWMVDDVPGSMIQEALAEKGWLDADVYDLKDGEFLMPGFIDTHTVSYKLETNVFILSSMPRKFRILGGKSSNLRSIHG